MSTSGGVRRCVCPGSFDPVTTGHVDVITRASRLFDEVVVAVIPNPDKAGLFTPSERRYLLQDSLSHLPGVRVELVGGGLLVDFCREVDAVAVVKGLRGGADYGYELQMALMNRHLTGVETVFVPGDPAYQHVSSSLVKEVAGLGGDVTDLVPAAVRSRLGPRLARREAG